MAKEPTKQYNFRLRFNLSKRQQINSNMSKSLISKQANGVSIEIRAAEEPEKLLKDVHRISIVGGPYQSSTEAEAEGQKWRLAAQTAFSYMNLGVDFGDRAPIGMFTDFGLKMAEAEMGRRALNDVHGLMTYVARPRPVFGHIQADVKVGVPLDVTLEMLNKSYDKNFPINSDERLAYDLYSSSFFQPSPDARFLTLMMSVETLAERKQRSRPLQEFVTSMIKETKGAGFDPKETDSMVGALRDLKMQSIGDSCKDLAVVLNLETYNGMDSVTFIGKCYGLRSKLVHGHSPRPTREDVDIMAAGLEIFVSHLLSMKLEVPFRTTSLVTGNVTESKS
jgi:hypothetical protein